jgi:hypothetical protein
MVNAFAEYDEIECFQTPYVFRQENGFRVWGKTRMLVMEESCTYVMGCERGVSLRILLFWEEQASCQPRGPPVQQGPAADGAQPKGSAKPAGNESGNGRRRSLRSGGPHTTAGAASEGGAVESTDAQPQEDSQNEDRVDDGIVTNIRPHHAYISGLRCSSAPVTGSFLETAYMQFTHVAAHKPSSGSCASPLHYRVPKLTEQGVNI